MASLLERPVLMKTQAYVGGRWTSADSGATFPVYDPATGETIADVPRCGATETRRAIDAAHAALPAWRATPGKERAKLVRKWFELIVQHTDELAHIMTLEQGKPLAEARAEIAMGAAYVEWNAEEAKRVYGDTIPTLANDRRMVVVKQPIGVCVGITPWNFPHAMVTRKASPAIAAGCTFVLKPAEQTPLSALAVAALAEEAGLPAGVFNVVTGDADDAPVIGEEMTANPIVRKLGFTGSTAVGKLLMAQCARTVKKVSLELGGNAPFIVFDDADVDAAVSGAMSAKFRNAGQVCVSPNRIFVQDGVHDAFVERLAERVRALRPGRGFDEGVTLGPLIEEQGFAKVVEHVEDACARGARVVHGGKPHALGRTFFEPTILTNVSADMRLSNEETFGPVAAIAPFASESDVIAMANDTPFGLAAYFYSRDVGRAWRVAEALEAGMVGINTPMIANELMPFGGIKESGIGREGSKYGIDEWVEIKYMCFGGLER
ncbi:MAG: NAD-dependent succinate-semialdehyde dehydrogenase [Candidatus Velthaea sp.]